MRFMVCLPWLFVCATAGAVELGGSFSGGPGVAIREAPDDPPFDQLDLEYDDGHAVRLQGTLRIEPAWLLRARYTFAQHDRFTALGTLLITEGLQQRDAQLGLFHSAPDFERFGYRLGAGYDYVRYSARSPPGDAFVQEGPFVEASALINAGRHVSFDLGGAFIRLEHEGANDDRTDRRELHLDAIFHAGAVDLTLGSRYCLDRIRNTFDLGGGPTVQELEETLLEVFLTAGLEWGYGARKP